MQRRLEENSMFDIERVPNDIWKLIFEDYIKKPFNQLGDCMKLYFWPELQHFVLVCKRFHDVATPVDLASLKDTCLSLTGPIWFRFDESPFLSGVKKLGLVANTEGPFCVHFDKAPIIIKYADLDLLWIAGADTFTDVQIEIDNLTQLVFDEPRWNSGLNLQISNPSSLKKLDLTMDGESFKMMHPSLYPLSCLTSLSSLRLNLSERWADDFYLQNIADFRLLVNLQYLWINVTPLSNDQKDNLEAQIKKMPSLNASVDFRYHISLEDGKEIWQIGDKMLELDSELRRNRKLEEGIRYFLVLFSALRRNFTYLSKIFCEIENMVSVEIEQLERDITKQLEYHVDHNEKVEIMNYIENEREKEKLPVEVDSFLLREMKRSEEQIEILKQLQQILLLRTSLEQQNFERRLQELSRYFLQ